jgi:cytochrome c-type biogenesis protein CcmH/NrfF
VAVRDEIARRVHAGQSDDVISTSLESRYGTAILLSPPVVGVGVLLWAVPVALLVISLVIMVVLARRRNSRA